MTTGIVNTIRQKCKRCYSCVRECPAKAIRVEGGQAVVIVERCISCGHCVKTCSQDAKIIYDNTAQLIYDILPGGNAVALIAPSFAASFPDNYKKFPSALRKIGFTKVIETAFGADLISPIYQEYFERSSDEPVISTACPAIYNYIEKYFIELVPNLAKIVSPMIAMGRYVKRNFGRDTKVVFIGPCVAKKSEYMDKDVDDAVDSVLTFKEIKDVFEKLGVDFGQLEDSEPDPPHAVAGKSFPLTGGLIKTARIDNDILAKEVIVVEGKDKVEEIIKDLAQNKIKAKFIDILFCEGCISGPAIDSALNYYSRREKVIDYIDSTINAVDKNVWKGEIYNSRDLNLKRDFTPRNQKKPDPAENEIIRILAGTNKLSKSDELNCGACGYPTCREYAIAIGKGLAEEDMCLPYLIDKLEEANRELKSTQNQLHTAEKLASIGQLAAGVAHEINNPLGTIMIYASMLKKEMERDIENAKRADDAKMIIEEASRCKNIVANLLNFARQGKLRLSKVDLVNMLEGLIKAVKLNPQYNEVIITLNRDGEIPEIDADIDQLKQVFLNLLNNACEATEFSNEKMVTIKLLARENNIVCDVIDTGCGIPQENMNKLFTPFFTTKKMGKGTGLGLPISYGIIKMHKGDIRVKSSSGNGSTFTIKLPVNLNIQQTII